MGIDNDSIFPYLKRNEDLTINMGMGYFIKSGVSPEQRKKLRELQDSNLAIGKPYWILDFLAEDFELDPDCIEYRNLCYYRKYKPKPKDDARESE